MTEADIDFILELRRLVPLMGKMLGELPPDKQKRYGSQAKWFFQQADAFINRTGIVFVAPEGAYDVGMAVNPLNMADFDKDAELVIDQVIEPIVMYDGKVVKAGTVLLKKAN